MICINCDNEVFADKPNAIIEQEYRNERLQVKMTASACTKCGWQTLSLGQTDELRRLTADAYREKHGLLTSVQIKAIRKLLGMNQPEFAAHIGVGEASVKRWETWLVQDNSSDQLIRMKCQKELNQMVASKQWVATLSATGWVSVSYDHVAGLVARVMQPIIEPNNNRFIAQKPSHQGVFWGSDEDLGSIDLTVENEDIALAA